MPSCDPLRLLLVGLVTTACGGEPRTATGSDEAAKAEVSADRAPATDAKLDTNNAPKVDEAPGVEADDIAEAEPSDALIFSDAAGLQLQSLADDKRTRLHAGAIHLCRHDVRAGVVWFFASEAEGAPKLSLHAIDLEGDRKAVEVVRDLPSAADGLAFKLDASTTREMTPFDAFGIGVLVDLSGAGKVARFVGCGSDVYDCIETYEPTPVLYPEYEAIAKAVEKATLLDAAATKTLVARDLKRPAPPPPVDGRIAGFDETACEVEPDDCGKTRTLPGTGLSLVVIANSRGDLYHEELQLYDAKTEEFMPLSDPTKRSKTPHATSMEIERLWVAADGQAYAFDDKLVHLARGVRAEHVSICGFVEPGPELTGVGI